MADPPASIRGAVAPDLTGRASEPAPTRRARAGRLVDAMRTAAGSIRAAVANRDIRRLLAAWTAGTAGDWILLVALLVVAFDVGGALAVGVLSVVRMLPTTLVGPLASVPAARIGSTGTLAAANLVRSAAAVGCAAVILVGAPIAIVFVLAAVGASAGALVRPIQNALLPSLARTPGELVAGNSVASLGEAAGTFVGPLVAGILVVGVGAGPTLVVASLVFIGAALAVSRVDAAEETESRRLLERGARRRPSLGAGFRALAARPGPALVFLGFMGQVFVRGLLVTLVVVASVELLGLGDAGVGWLNAAVGAGGLLGAIAAAGLSGRVPLSRVFAVSLAFWGLPIAVIGGWPLPLVALLALFVTGLSNASLDVAGFTILQRSLTLSERVPVFGLFEGGVGVAMALGGIAGPVLVGLFGARGALVVGGAILPLISIATWPRIRHVERESMVPEEQLHLAREIPLFGPLNLSELERLASAMTPVTFLPGEVIMREGDPGDRYVIIDDGSVEVTQGGKVLRTSGHASGVGEIALLREVPRTATVTAVVLTHAYALDALAFKSAMAGPRAWAAAEAVMAERLDARSPDGPG